MTEVIKEALRTCRNCGKQAFTEDDLEGFTKSSRYRYKRKNLCKPCASGRTRRWQVENADHVAEYKREYQRAYYTANRKRIAEYKRDYHIENRDRIRAYQREYYSGAFGDRLVWDVRELSYLGIHNRLRAHFGKASDYACVHCDGPAREWAYTNDDPDPRYDDNGNNYTVAYSLLPEYYQPMCIDCHRAFDADHRNGQEA